MAFATSTSNLGFVQRSFQLAAIAQRSSNENSRISAVIDAPAGRTQRGRRSFKPWRDLSPLRTSNGPDGFPTSWRRTIAPFARRNFSLYWVGFVATNTGRWIELTGAVWLVYELSGSPALLGLLGLARAGPVILLSPIGGVLADRLDQRKLLFTTQSLALLVSLVLGLLVASGVVELWHIYVQVMIQSAITAFDASVRQALFPRTVPRALLPEAVTLHSMAGRTSALIGPVLGGLAIATLGEASPFLLNSVTFLALMAAVSFLHGIVPRSPVPGSTLRGELVEGLKYLLAAPVLSGLLRLELVFGSLSVNAVIITIMARDVLEVGPEGLGGLLSANALGGLIGIVGMLILGQTRRQGRFVVLCALAYATVMVGFAVSRVYTLTFLTLVAAGLLDSVMTVTRQGIAQLAAPGRMRGRVMANIGIITRGVTPLAETQSGILAGFLGGPLAVLTGAVALGVSAAATGRFNRALWAFSRDDAVRFQPELLDVSASPDDPVAYVEGRK